ncbi:RYamide receptor [Lingula anatina]|uniref:RYamide receptor n=1 Tax=Lingula anatina TaxID=7574 RepID=A0A1S3IXU4_LINAN|nr:RYamide receptor [Lingula anatina]XP_013402795.1 RYamide receptor [Lingula anatina]XP_013402796.1 RYamide receptor [Lingula anatina]XP_013402797.1 RYamide receptor [Lingula anatina]XP_013402799.1 RYamide receptor [Lingula anatina]XP_013402800.1 RYamide receptor [Lingula anatina]XP_013402801.1 RYamide receptor [Lingula anatina]|eukprot:XP_013402794.1 RYamide receptor [Lingula anatina]
MVPATAVFVNITNHITREEPNTVDGLETIGMDTTTLSGNASNNVTEIPYFIVPGYVTGILIVLYSAITVLAIGGNSLVCYVVLAYQRMRTVTNYFIVNLAVSDILMAVLCIPLTFVANILLNYWPFGALLCPIVLYVQAVSVFLSAFTLVAISVDRYVAIIYPLRKRMTSKMAVIVIANIWFLSLVVPLPTAILSKVDEDNKCYEHWHDWTQRFQYTAAIMVLQYVLPLCVLSFTYLRIGVVIWVQKIPGEALNNRDQRMAASKRKMVKMMITVVSLYAICWLPLHAITLIGDRHPGIYFYKYINLIWISIHWLAMSNSCINPIVYCWMNSKFRNGFRFALRWCPCFRIDLRRAMSDRLKSAQNGGSRRTSVRNSVALTLSNFSSYRKHSEDSPVHLANGDRRQANREERKLGCLKEYMTRRPSLESPGRSCSIADSDSR